MKYFVALGVPLGVALLGFGILEVFDQHRKITRYRPVEAEVLAHELQRAGRDTFKPLTEYEYEVDGKTYTSDTVLPFTDSGARVWAQRILDRFPVGQAHEAWYDPDDPSQAFLWRQYQIFPYMTVLISLGMVIGSVYTFLGLHRQGQAPRLPASLPDGWYQFALSNTLVGTIRNCLLLSLLWFGSCVLLCGHFFLVVEGAYTGRDVAATCVALAFGGIPAGLGFYAWWIFRWMDDACVLVDRPVASPGDVVQVRVEQLIKRRSAIRQLSLALKCRRQTRRFLGLYYSESTETLYEEELTFLEGRACEAGETVAVDAEFVLPLSGVPQSGREPGKSIWGGSHIDWVLALRTKVEGVPAYPDDLRIQVDEGSFSEIEVI